MRKLCYAATWLGCLLLIASCGIPSKTRIPGIVYVSDQGPTKSKYLYLIESDGSERRVLAESKEVLFNGPLSPDGEKVLYTTGLSRGQSEIWVMALDGSEPIPLLRGSGPRDAVGASWSSDGKRIAFATPWEKGSPVCSHEFYVMDLASGALTRLPITGWHYEWSPTDDRMAILCTDGKPVGMYVLDVNTGEKKELLSGVKISEPQLAWSPDGRSIALPMYVSQDRMVHGIFVVDVGSGHLRQVTTEDATYLSRGISCLSWSPKGDRMLFRSDYATTEVKGAWALFVLDLASGKETKVAEEAKWACPVWSPDGEEIAFVSTAHPNPKYRQYGQIYKINLATGKVTQLTDDLDPKFSLSWGWVVLPRTEH